MSYHQITAAERYTLALLRRQGCTPAAIARVLGRHRSTIGRELRRNAKRYDGYYRADVAHWYATGRRARSRRNRRFDADAWQLVRARLAEQWSPDSFRRSSRSSSHRSQPMSGSSANGRQIRTSPGRRAPALSAYWKWPQAS